MMSQQARTILALLLLLAQSACIRPIHSIATTPTAQVAPAESLVIRNGTVLAGQDAAPVPDGVVIIQGDRIQAVGRAADWAVPPRAKVIDAQGGTILPGLVDARVHGAYDASVRRLFLTEGVTAICDVSAPLSALTVLAQENTSDGPVARGFHTGPIITAPGGYPDSDAKRELRSEVVDADEGRAAVQEQAGRGIDIVTIALDPGPPEQPLPLLSVETAQAVVEEAHAHGLLVRAYAPRAEGLDIALAVGVDVLEPVPVPQAALVELQPVQRSTARRKLPDVLEAQLAQAAAQGIILVPALDVTMAVSCGDPDQPVEQQNLCREQYLEVVRRYREVGGQVALGNDYSADPSMQMGLPLQEMQLLQAVGLTPQEVIQAATWRAARACGHDELGALAPGKTADIIVVAGDPLADLQALEAVRLVIQGGQIAYRE